MNHNPLSGICKTQYVELLLIYQVQFIKLHMKGWVGYYTRQCIGTGPLPWSNQLTKKKVWVGTWLVGPTKETAHVWHHHPDPLRVRFVGWMIKSWQCCLNTNKSPYPSPGAQLQCMTRPITFLSCSVSRPSSPGAETTERNPSAVGPSPFQSLLSDPPRDYRQVACISVYTAHMWARPIKKPSLCMLLRCGGMLGYWHVCGGCWSHFRWFRTNVIVCFRNGMGFLKSSVLCGLGGNI